MTSTGEIFLSKNGVHMESENSTSLVLLYKICFKFIFVENFNEINNGIPKPNVISLGLTFEILTFSIL